MAPSKKFFKKIDEIEIKNVSKKYGAVIAVNQVSLNVIGGELLILLGPSGCGKTTLLRMINRLVETDDGQILINGQDVKNFNPVLLRKNIGYVIQQIGLFPHMTVKENISLVPKLEGWTEKDMNQRVRELLELVSLPPEQFLNRRPKELSGGQQQRIGLARAMVMDSPLLLMDEPFGALDPILRKQLQEEFIRVKERLQRTIIFVTHDIEEAFRLGDRVAILKEGQLIQVARKNELLVNPANDFIADIVDSNKKFRHLDNLTVKDTMLPLEKKYIFPADETAQSAIQKMIEEQIEFGIVLENHHYKGTIKLNQLYANQEKKLKEIFSQVPTYNSTDSVATALDDMKKNNNYIGIVMEDEPIGILLSDELLSRLI
jgi:osmoprotectant transport system ATP-binding protein